MIGLEILVPTQQDLEDIYKIEKDNFKFGWTKDYINFNINLSNEICKFFIAKIKGEIIGYIICWVSDNTAHLLKIAVKKVFQKQGIASKLLKYLFNELLKCNVLEVILEVGINNFSAISLYKKFKFNKVVIKKKFYPDGEDAIIMFRNLSNEEALCK
ncbi:MAG: ribosomal protein S18-alanine N-acetyltransferase [Endomicrobia bacterium]|nr:ribosomal protein S18-alanine N-acetyltransferase [Endomicrobiia bacterium]